MGLFTSKKNLRQEQVEAITNSTSSLSITSKGGKKSKSRFWKRSKSKKNQRPEGSSSPSGDSDDSSLGFDVPEVSEKVEFMRASAGVASMQAIQQRMAELEKKYAAAMDKKYAAAMDKMEETDEEEETSEKKTEEKDKDDQLSEMKSSKSSDIGSGSMNKSILKKSCRFTPETFFKQQSLRMSDLSSPEELGDSTSTSNGSNKSVQSVMESSLADFLTDADSSSSASIHHLSKSGNIGKSFKVKKAFLGVKDNQQHELTVSKKNDELDIAGLYGEPQMTKTMNMDPEFDAAFAPEDMRCLALVSHNNMKASMKQFVIANQNLLKKFRLTGTNTTMTMLKSVFGDDPDVVYGPTCASGPLGGDAQLVALAVTGEIGGCIFFIDPMDAHPHSADIDTLVRQGNVYNLVMLNNPSTAHVCCNALRLALKMGQMELFPSFFFDLESPSVAEYKKRQQAVLDRQIAEGV